MELLYLYQRPYEHPDPIPRYVHAARLFRRQEMDDHPQLNSVSLRDWVQAAPFARHLTFLGHNLSVWNLPLTLRSLHCTASIMGLWWYGQPELITFQISTLKIDGELTSDVNWFPPSLSRADVPGAHVDVVQLYPYLRYLDCYSLNHPRGHLTPSLYYLQAEQVIKLGFCSSLRELHCVEEVLINLDCHTQLRVCSMGWKVAVRGMNQRLKKLICGYFSPDRVLPETLREVELTSMDLVPLEEVLIWLGVPEIERLKLLLPTVEIHQDRETTVMKKMGRGEMIYSVQLDRGQSEVYKVLREMIG